MKPLFFALALANSVFFLWASGLGRTPMREEQTDFAQVERIVLIKELPAADVSAAEPASATPANPEETAAAVANCDWRLVPFAAAASAVEMRDCDWIMRLDQLPVAEANGLAADVLPAASE